MAIDDFKDKISKLSPQQAKLLHDLLVDEFESTAEITEEFAASIERGKKEIAEGRGRRKER